VRAIDRAARVHGLTLASYPDSSGDTPIGSLIAVGSTAGMGMGRCLPIDQITGATIVTGEGEVVRVGASHALGHASFTRHGLPDVLGLAHAAEGRAFVITEVGVALAPAGFTVEGRAHGRSSELPIDLASRSLAAARVGLDRGVVDTFRFETGAKGRSVAFEWECLFRVFSLRSPEDALLEATRLARDLEAQGLPSFALEPESPAQERRYTVPEGEHRKTLKGGAFWGAEVAVGWGPELGACLDRLATLFEALGAHAPLHRRLALYPGHHVLSLGTQVLARRDETSVDAVRATIEAALSDLIAHGGVPYRTGNLWRAALDAKAPDARTLAESVFRALDPEGVLPGAAGRASSQ
jgi:hypothetical protein